MRSVRARLTATLLALVAGTAIVLGVGAYAFVDTSLHERVLRDAEAQARFDLTEIVPERLDDGEALREIFRRRNVDVVIDDGRADPTLEAFRRERSPAVRDLAAGALAYEWTTIAARPSLIVAGRLSPSGPTFYFVHDASGIEASLGALRAGLVGGAIVLVAVALAAARGVARGVLAPVAAASRAAQRLERGDLDARIRVASRDEFGEWALRFNRMAGALQSTIEQLEASQAQNRRFVADVSHELRTPLTALVAEASILREHLAGLPPDARRTGELLVADVGRLRTLVDDLMELSRFDASAEEVAAEAVDLGRIVPAIVAARAPGVPVWAPDEPLVVQAEPRRVERILGNLLDNAREHAPGAPVEVRVRRRDGWAYMEVLDRGPGIPPDRIDRIFERFFKVDPSRRGGSSGLGLAIAAEHAALLGGRLRAFNRPDGGLRMALRLPVTESLPAGDRVAIGPTDPMAATQSSRGLQP